MPSRKNRHAPEWAIEPFERFLDEAEQIGNLVRLSCSGISVLRGMPKIIEVLANFRNEDPLSSKVRIKQAKKDAELADSEVRSDFPLINSWAVIALWALLESSIRVFAAQWLRKKRTAWRFEAIRKLRIKIGDYESIPKNQRYEYVVELLERELGAGFRNGVNRFELILDAFDLSGPVPEKLSQDIFEMSQVRNFMAHNRMKVDKRLKDSCPWLKLKIGDDFKISSIMLRKYYTAVHSYVILIICRLGEFHNIDMSDSKDDILKNYS